jgi:hypothetical protein
LLFDVRGAGRRRAIKITYSFLAILMGAGLVFFGIGGAVSGGLLDAFKSSSTSSSDAFKDDITRLNKRLAANPNDAAALAALARTQYQVAGTGDNYDSTTGQFTQDGIRQLRKVKVTWDRYLALKPKKPDDNVASLMVQAFGPAGLNDPTEAVVAQEIIVDARKPSANLFTQLAIFAYQAGQTRKGDLAAQRAVDLTDKDLKAGLKERLKQAKQIGASGSQGTTTQAPSINPEG